MTYLPKTTSFELLLERYNAALAAEFGSDHASPGAPTTAQIVGLPRSGTTVLYQLLAKTGAVGYPSNLMAFAWRAPAVGAALQMQLSSTQQEISLRSIAGRTSEPLGPHEFGYFWRDALGHEHNALTPSRNRRSATWIRNQLDLVSQTFDKATVYKNFLAPAHIDFLRHDVGNQKFILIRREPHDIALSLLSIRRRLKIPSTTPFSTMPPEPPPSEVDEIGLIAHQVTHLEHMLHHSGISPHSDTLEINYHDLCLDPRGAVASILSHLGIPETYSECIPRSLDTTARAKDDNTSTHAERLRLRRMLQ